MQHHLSNHCVIVAVVCVNPKPKIIEVFTFLWVTVCILMKLNLTLIFTRSCVLVSLDIFRFINSLLQAFDEK